MNECCCNKADIHVLGQIMCTDRIGQGLPVNGCFIYSIELESGHISHEYQTKQIYKSEALSP